MESQDLNIVKISLKDYNELRDFKVNMESKKSFRVSQYIHNSFTSGGYFASPFNYVSSEVAVEEISKLNESLTIAVEKLQKQLDDKDKKQPASIDDVKKLSIFSLLRWRYK